MAEGDRSRAAGPRSARRARPRKRREDHRRQGSARRRPAQAGTTVGGGQGVFARRRLSSRRDVARSLHRQDDHGHPHRQNFRDYLRNGPEATAVAAYSTRARPGAPVSVPIAWEELSDSLRSDSYNLDNIRERLSQLVQDPWRGYYTLQQRITAKAMRSFKLT